MEEVERVFERPWNHDATMDLLGHAGLSDWVAVPGACVMEAALGLSESGALRLPPTAGSPRIGIWVRVMQTSARRRFGGS